MNPEQPTAVEADEEPLEVYDVDVCPVAACRSRRVVHVPPEHALCRTVAQAWGTKVSAPIATCRDCGAFWETWPRDTSSDDVERAKAQGPCDNCAYRNSSPESADGMVREQLAEYAELASADFDQGQHPRHWFGCHKGIPIVVEDGSIRFDYEATGLLPQSQTCAGFLRLLWAAGARREREAAT